MVVLKLVGWDQTTVGSRALDRLQNNPPAAGITGVHPAKNTADTAGMGKKKIKMKKKEESYPFLARKRRHSAKVSAKV